MTSVSSVASTGSLYQTLGTTSTKHKSAVDVAASVLGMSTDDLKAELKSGKSMDDVAKEKGVSTDDLTKALADNMPAGMAKSGDATTIAAKIASQVGGPDEGRGKQGPPPPPPSADSSTSDSTSSSSKSVLADLASLLGTDADTLKSTLSSGTSTLSDLLQQSGVSMSALAGAVQQGVLVDTSA